MSVTANRFNVNADRAEVFTGKKNFRHGAAELTLSALSRGAEKTGVGVRSLRTCKSLVSEDQRLLLFVCFLLVCPSVDTRTTGLSGKKRRPCEEKLKATYS